MAFQDYHICSWVAHASPTPFTLRILTMAASDPTTWTVVSASGNYTPNSHVCANPQAFQHPTNGYWYLAHSNADETFSPSWQNYPTAAKLSFARSADGGVTFTPLVDLDYSAQFAAVFGSCWFKDRAGVIHHIFPASPVGGGLGDTGLFQMYEIHPTASDLTAWSSPVQLTGTSIPSTYQDPCIVDDGSNYYLFYGPGGGGQSLKNATSAASFPLTGWAPFYTSAFNMTGQNVGGDGPTMKSIATKWWLYYEKTNGGGIHYLNQNAGAADWRGTNANTFTLDASVNGVNTERAGSISLIQVLPTPTPTFQFSDGMPMNQSFTRVRMV